MKEEFKPNENFNQKYYPLSYNKIIYHDEIILFLLGTPPTTSHHIFTIGITISTDTKGITLLTIGMSTIIILIQYNYSLKNIHTYLKKIV